jgi:glycine/D-amino acid oxidase-like deaminating enzyme
VHPRGGLLHPLKYARGLAAAAARAGAHVFGDSPITRIERAGDKWQLATTAGGTIRAEKVLTGHQCLHRLPLAGA